MGSLSGIRDALCHVAITGRVFRYRQLSQLVTKLSSFTSASHTRVLDTSIGDIDETCDIRELTNEANATLIYGISGINHYGRRTSDSAIFI